MPPITRSAAVLMLLLCTALWGFAFVAQKTAMASMGPLTFGAVRYLLGGLSILPLAIWEYRRLGKPLGREGWALVGAVSIALFFGAWLQQVGLLTTTATNGGFLTGLYVLFVPLFALPLMRVRPHPVLGLGVPLALLGLFLLNGGHIDRFNGGDVLIIACAAFWAMHVLLLGALVRLTGLPITVSALSFLAVGLVESVLALVFEAPTLAALAGGWREILYAGVLSTGVAFTLQAIGQQYVPPANAAIILSSESLFAALGAALLLGERLSPLGYWGAGLMFASILLVESVPALLARRQTPVQPYADLHEARKGEA